MANLTHNNVSQKWIEGLKTSGYDHHCSSVQDLEKIKKLGRIWRKILKETGLKSPDCLFELGCGGGRHLAALSLKGFKVHGIDVSPDVVDRCHNYLQEIESVASKSLSITVENADIFDYESEQKYDLTYHFGVVEHFLELSDRHKIWKKLYELTKPGGYVVSVVPNGSHFWRKHIRENNLCGYNISEIDYDLRLHKQEFLDAGLENVTGIPWNYFGFAEGITQGKLQKIIGKSIHLSSNAIIPFLPLPSTIKEKFAHGLLVLGRKPNIYCN